MPSDSRNTFVDGDWVLRKVTDYNLCGLFDCGDSDINEYFHIDALLHQKELLAQSYYLHLQPYPLLIIALLDFCNDSIHVDQYKTALKSHRDMIPIVESKRHGGIPAVKLTRFGVQKEYQGNSFGSYALNVIKKFFTTDNRTGCRLITVDANNKPEVIRFYERNGFQLFGDKDITRETRSMFFDLKRYRP
jgi:GNAT superfamily N-acetyltransferase